MFEGPPPEEVEYAEDREVDAPIFQHGEIEEEELGPQPARNDDNQDFVHRDDTNANEDNVHPAEREPYHIEGPDRPILINNVDGADAEAEAEAGPANGQPVRRRDQNRDVGAKKAKSLARRNQQRAYNEFLREQGEAERAEWARDAKEREEEARAERERRAVAEAKIQERERRAREERKTREEMERKSEIEACRKAVVLVTDALEEGGAISVDEVAKSAGKNKAWVQKLAAVEGILGTKDVDGKKQVTILTARGWIVRIDQDLMSDVYSKAAKWNGKSDGKVTWEHLGRVVQETLRNRSN